MSYKTDYTSIDRTSDAYLEGRQAYLSKLTMDDCPHPRDQARIDWCSGWLDQWSELKHGKLFRKYRTSVNATSSSGQRRQHRRVS